MGAFPLGGRCLRPRLQTDEGRPCHCRPVTGCQGTLSHISPLRGQLLPQGRSLFRKI